MYLPPAFATKDLATLHDLIEAYNFGTLVSQGPDGPYASHIPFLLDRARGANGTLVAHLSRGNPHGRYLADHTAMAVFVGPHGYISPSWYAMHPAVPTWNYAAVHAYGTPHLIEDPAALRAIVIRLVAMNEGGRPAPWTTDDLPAEFMSGMLKGIVGFEIPIERIEGKLKLSQNRSAEDRRRVIATLGASEAPRDRLLADYMSAHANPTG
jgi:transcriptional regulator